MVTHPSLKLLTKKLGPTFLFVMTLGIGGLSLQSAQAEAPKALLVQSVPVETDLKIPGLLQASETWVKLIRSAKKTIDLAQMYITSKRGEALEPIMAELTSAAKRGVKIRFLVSHNFIDNDPAALEAVKRIPHLELKILNLNKITGGILHAKYWIVDGKRVYIGSQNFDWRSLKHIHETGLLIEEPSVTEDLQKIFEYDWFIADSNIPPEKKQPQQNFSSPNSRSIQLVASPPSLNPEGVKSALPELLKLLKAAKRTIAIQLLDFSNEVYKSSEKWIVLETALKDAASRGVKVLLLVSHWNLDQSKIESIQKLARVKNIDVRFSTIPTHSSGKIPFARVIHSKYMVIDSAILWLGTSNWSKSYFTQVRNVEVIVRNQKLALEAQEIFKKVWEAPFTEKLDPNKKYPKPEK